jgi:hypothetical protein
MINPVSRSVFRKPLHALNVDRYGKYIYAHDDDLLLVEIKITEAETQVYIVDSRDMSVFLDQSYWVDAQLSMVNSAMNSVAGRIDDLPKLSHKIILAGTWHFGHLIGDQAHRLIIASRQGTKNGLPRKVHYSVNPLTNSWINKTLFLNPFIWDQDCYSKTAYDQPIRIYKLKNSIIFFGSEDKSLVLSIASEHIKLKLLKPYSGQRNTQKIFLTSQRESRIANIKNLCIFLRSAGWQILNPLKSAPASVLKATAEADFLIAENGSILFNCLLARSLPYIVLASERNDEALMGGYWAGGGVYNDFHKQLISYFQANTIAITHHPYSDQITVDLSKLSKRIIPPALFC